MVVVEMLVLGKPPKGTQVASAILYGRFFFFFDESMFVKVTMHVLFCAYGETCFGRSHPPL